MDFDGIDMKNFGLTDRTIELVRTWAPVLLPRVPDVVEAYYAFVRGGPLGDLMKRADIAELKALRIAHWRLLLEGDFVAIRAHYAERIGPRLVDGGFPRAIFIMAGEWFALEFTRLVDREPTIPRAICPELRAAIVRFAFFDIALAQAAREVACVD